MAYLDKGSLWLIKEEASYADTGTVFSYTTDVVEMINPTMDANTDLIEREVLKNSLVKAQPVLGKETSSGSFGLEATGLVAGDLNGAVLYKSGMGNEIAAVATADVSAEATGNTVTTIDVPTGTGANYTAGAALKVTFGATADEYVVIRSIATDTLTISPALVGTPTDVTDIEGLLSYTIARPSDPAVSFAVKEYFEDGTTPITYDYRGVVVSDMTIDFPLANIIKSTFNVAGAGFTVTSGVTDQVRQCKDLTPHIAKNMTFTYDGTSYDVADLSINVASDIYDVEAITTDGLTNKLVTGKSNVGGSFSLEYAGVDLFNAYEAGTDGELFGLVETGTAAFGVYAPKVILTGANKSIDGGVYKDNIDITMLSSPLCSDTVEDAVTIFFA